MDKFKKIIYDNYISNHNKNLYGENSLARIKAYAPALNYYYCRHIPADKTIRILDIGCGDGNFVYHLQQLGYKSASGIDVSEEQINKGTSMGIGNLHRADLLDYLSANKQAFDVIIAKDVIEHFTRDEVFEILPLINCNLKSGGRFIMQVPNGQGMFYTSIFYGDYTHEMAYTESSINQVMLNTGFSSVRCYPTGPIPAGVVSRIRYILWKLMVWKLKFWKMVETGSPKGIFTQNIISVAEKK
ncbi:MAG: class I SAM-dependent methyltransferase [Taibaiella sp.]|nr:class I SAM-dependent methyltransferase [Taibaiella sp.]